MIYWSVICSIVLFLVGSTANSRQQIPFGFFRAPAAPSSFLESFENFTGAFPTGWTDCSSGMSPYSGVAPAQTTATGATDGTSSALFSTGSMGSTSSSCIQRTIDLTGYTNVSIDLTNYFGCIPGTGVSVNFASAPYTTALAASSIGTNSGTFSGRGLTTIKVIAEGTDCGVYADRLRFW